MVLASSPVLEYVVAVEPVFDTIVDQVVPPSVEFSIFYPVIAEPPLSTGAAHERLICDLKIAVAVSPVGEAPAISLMLPFLYHRPSGPTLSLLK